MSGTLGTRSRAIRRGTSRSSLSASPMAAHAYKGDVAFVSVYGRATPDRAGARPYPATRADTPADLSATSHQPLFKRRQTIVVGAPPRYEGPDAYWNYRGVWISRRTNYPGRAIPWTRCHRVFAKTCGVCARLRIDQTIRTRDGPERD